MLILCAMVDAGISYSCELEVRHMYEKRTHMVWVVDHNGEEQQIDDRELMVGDIYRVETGMRIPADSILIKEENTNDAEFSPAFDSSEAQFLCNETEVTGIDATQPKGIVTDSLKGDKLQSSNVLYRRSYVVQGSGYAVVCCVGYRT